MTFKRGVIADMQKNKCERRSGLNRRWIKAAYNGVERRCGADRRNELSQGPPGSPVVSSDRQLESLENILLATTLRLEALARLLVAKGVLSPDELAEVLRTMQAEYQSYQAKKY
jgi:hypothetical protein